MRRVIANDWMSLERVIQSSGSDDDPVGRFPPRRLAPPLLRRDLTALDADDPARKS